MVTRAGDSSADAPPIVRSVNNTDRNRETVVFFIFASRADLGGQILNMVLPLASDQ
jgi:hypothetical protein